MKVQTREEVAGWLLNYGQPTRTKQALEYFLTIKKGIPSLTPILERQIRHFVELDRSIPGLPWDKIYNEFCEQKKFNNQRHRNKSETIMKLPIYQIKNLMKNELEDEARIKKLPHNQLVEEPLLDPKYSPKDTPPNKYLSSTDPSALPEREKPKKLYDSTYVGKRDV